jgi:hypothetical protein
MSNKYSTNDYNEREGRVLGLYDQGKNTCEIAKELRMSLRDIGFILKKGQVNHRIAIMDNSNNSSGKSPNEKAITIIVENFEEFFTPPFVNVVSNHQNSCKTVSNIL